MRGLEEKKPQKMVRSSIACARCRRSKVKCVNNGVHSVCKACAQSNRECTYPVAGSTPTPKRSEVPTGIKQEGESGESKKRIRKLEDAGRRNSHRPGEDVLESPILTKKVWDELYEIFKLHFSTEMPFLHPPTFRNRMRQASFPRDPATSPSDIEEGRVLLLGVLTLTARFHPILVAHHSPNGEDPLAASEFYATPLANAFGPTVRNLTTPSLENIQALLMLGLYEWGQTRGLSAWLYVGLAIRLAFPMGLAYEDDPNSVGLQDPRKVSGRAGSTQGGTVEKEVRRRTLWSCFIMDRMLAAGKYRPTMMSVEKLRVQLPCSDDQFLFVHNVQTGFLSTEWMDNGCPTPSSVNDDAVLSRYIRLVDIFGRLSEWSYAGGRRTEKFPPWDQSTQFFKLRRQLEDFHDSLPPSLTFTEANLSAHIEKRNATTYASMHTLYSLCQIMLHREYIPFLPLRCMKPVGPLDEPTFPEERFEIPEGFWEDSADKIMRAARDIINIIKTCQDDGALPESPQLGFAIWQAAFVCMYAAYFPHMDMSNHLTNSNNAPDKSKGYTQLTKKLLTEIAPRLKMVKGYLRLMGRMEDFFRQVSLEYVQRFKPKSFSGGGLEEYKRYEKDLKEFGELKDAEGQGSEGSDTVDQTRSRASTNDIPGSSVNGEAMQGVETASAQRPNGAWAPINAASPPVEADERPKYNHGPYPYGMPYQQSPVQTSNAPSLIASNGESTSGLNSPYASNQVPQYSQPPHVAAYPSIAQHSMAPPNVQQAGYHDNEAWITDKESISINAEFDNFSQQMPPEFWASGYVPGVQHPNYIQAIEAGMAGQW